MRLFIGLPVPESLAKALAHFAQGIHLPKTRWVPPENIHLTLIFLGEVAEDRLPCIVHALDGLEPQGLFLRLTVLGAFPRAGVLFADVEPNPKLLTLQSRVAARMAVCGFALDPRPYHPHITLARMRPPARLARNPPTLPPAVQRSFPVEQINLYRSHTTPTGAWYEVLATRPAGRALAIPDWLS